MKRLIVLVALLGLASPIAATAAAFKVVVHPDNPTTSLSAKDVSNLLLKHKRKWDHGPAVEPLDLDASSPVREAFTEAVHGRSVSSIKNYWQRRIFSGRGMPPPELENDGAVLQYVRSHAGAIGYVSGDVSLAGVKTLSITKK